MTESHFSNKIKILRTAKAMSQEELAEKSGLSLRTIQRVENNETEPRGNSLKRLAQALQTTPDEVIEWRLEEDRSYMVMVALGSCAFALFPLLGIFITMIFWILKKDKSIEHLGKEILNFQITWTLAIGMVVILFMYMTFFGINNVKLTGFQPFYLFVPFILISLFVLFISLINVFRISKGQTCRYLPAIKFFK